MDETKILHGVEVNIIVYREDYQEIDSEFLMDELIRLVESHGWYLSGSTKHVDLNDG